MSASSFSTRRTTLAAGVVAVSFTLVAAGTSGSSASIVARDSDRLTPTESVTGSAASALAENLRISAAEARHRLRAQRGQDLLADRLVDRLGGRQTAGAYIDARTGDLVVNVTTAPAARAVRAAGATVDRVRYSSHQLNAVHAALDAMADDDGAGRVQGWYVDVPTDTVIVTTTAGDRSTQTREFLAQARSFGERVDVDPTTARTRPAAYLYGGQQVNMSNGYVCSLGFNAKTSSGASVFVTAGHCAEGNPTFSRNGTTIGGTRGYSFPTNDYAAVNINNPTYWNPQGAVDMYNGYARLVVGKSRAAVGSALCKSGRTTGWTCGTIKSYNQTVNYGGGDIVSGLVRNSACVQQGDSGGSNMSGNYAQGVTSGAQLYSSGGSLVCGEKVGQPNVSYYQPIGEALNAYGLTLVTQ